MKTISLNDDLFVLIEKATMRSGKKNIAEFLEAIPEVLHERELIEKARGIELQIQILKRVDDICHNRTLSDRFVIAMNALLKVSPQNFSKLEGFTRPGGQIVFISSTKQTIENTAPKTKPMKLPSGEWYVNASGGKAEFEIVIDATRKLLGIPVGFVENLKQITILRPETEYI